MSEQLKDKVAIVTGSSSGIGEAIAIMFAARGAKVTLCGRDQERLKQVYDKAVMTSGGHQDRFHIVQGDLNDPNVRKVTIAQTIEKFGKLDILVANAAVISVNSTILDATEDSYDFTFNTNVKSVFFLVQQAVPQLELCKGNIIIISSILSTMACQSLTVYSMSKASVDHLTRCLAVDLGPKGIRVNTINSGYIPTRIVRVYGPDAEKVSREIESSEIAKCVLKTRNLTVEDIAETATFLASDAAGFITGENIKVDGGRSYSGAYTGISHAV